MRHASVGGVILATLALAKLASGQAPFQLLVVQGNNVTTVQSGGTVSFSAEIGQTQTAQFVATYTGSGRVSFTQQPQLIGSSEYTVTSFVSNAGGATFGIQFHPTSADSANALFNLPFSETITTGTAGTSTGTTGTTTGLTSTTSNSAIVLTLQGGAPSIVLSYVLPADQNVIPLAPGSTLVFPPTQITTTAQATFTLTNRGSGTGTINAISITGPAFKISGIPLLPATLTAGQQLNLTIQYLPQAIQTDSGSIQVGLGSGVVNIALQGSGVGSSFAYSLIAGSLTTTLTPNGSASLPDTAVGQSTSVVIRVRNTGSSSGQIASASILGAGFQIVAPPALPQTLAPNATLLLTVTFTPAQPGISHAQLQIGADTFDLSGNGLGAQLVFSYISGGSTIPVASGGSVIFSPVSIGQTASLTFSVRNAGTQTAPLANVGIMEHPSPFSLSGLPALPANLAPNAEFDFTINFTPTAVGFASGTLRLDSATVALSGSGVPLPSLPAYTIGGPNGVVNPASQPAFTLTLSTPYNLDLTGVLTLTVVGQAGGDPAVQFSTGGRSVNFVIPANTTSAIFPNQTSQIRLQTGTVASTITLTPSFTTSVGGTDVTPSSPAVLMVSVSSLAPTLQTVRIDNQTSTSFTLSVTGFSTTRTLSDVLIAFTAAPGFKLANSQVTYALSADASAWFQSAASQAFGSQFTVAIPFTFQSNTGSSTPISALKSMSITATNEIGTSNALQINF